MPIPNSAARDDRSLAELQTPEQVVTTLNDEYDDMDDQRAHILRLCASLTSVAVSAAISDVTMNELDKSAPSDAMRRRRSRVRSGISRC